MKKIQIAIKNSKNTTKNSKFSKNVLFFTKNAINIVLSKVCEVLICCNSVSTYRLQKSLLNFFNCFFSTKLNKYNNPERFVY